MSGGAPGSQEREGAAAADPSMEDILASIRRILNEEDKTDGSAPEAAAGPAELNAEAADVLVLDETMMVEVPGEALPVASMATAVVAVPQPPEPVAMSEPPLPVPFPPPALVAPEAAASAAASVGALMRTLASERSSAVHRGGPTIEDLVREEIRPVLKEWLDQHLPPMVERLVRAEIERVVSRMA